MKKREVRLNIGAGKTYIPGFVNIDLSQNADISLDISSEKLPFRESSVDLIFSYHTLEHIPDYLFALSEIHRVLKHGGRFLVGLPYITSTKYNLVNPYHLHNFNEFSFDFFEKDKLKGSAVEDNAIEFKKIFHIFHYIGIFNVIPQPLRLWCRRHLINVVEKIDFGLVAKKNTEDIITDKNKCIEEFYKCLNSRIPYRNSSNDKNSSVLRTGLQI